MRKVAKNTRLGYNYILVFNAIILHKITAAYACELYCVKHIDNQKGPAKKIAGPFWNSVISKPTVLKFFFTKLALNKLGLVFNGIKGIG